jgi:hypothetical protein
MAYAEDGIDMKPQKLLIIGFLVLISVSGVSAQNTLPNPNDNSCWSSLEALRACQLQAYNAEAGYAQRCTSYPEYQCAPVEQPNPENARAQADKNKGAKTSHARKPGLKPLVPSESGTQTASAK